MTKIFMRLGGYEIEGERRPLPLRGYETNESRQGQGSSCDVRAPEAACLIAPRPLT